MSQATIASTRRRSVSSPRRSFSSARAATTRGTLQTLKRASPGDSERGSVPCVRGHCQDVGLRLVHVDSSRLSFATGAWAAEPWCCSEDERASPAVLERLELPVLGDRGLVL